MYLQIRRYNQLVLNLLPVLSFRNTITNMRSLIFFKPFILLVPLFLFYLASCLLLLGGCGGSIKYTLANDYGEKMPNLIAVMPITGDIGDKDAQHLFRNFAYEKLKQMGYSPISLETIDDKLLRSGIRRDELNKKTPSELATILTADSLMYIVLSDWDASVFFALGSLKIAVNLELYEGVSGKKLWEAEFETKDSEISLERDVIEYSVVKTYEPVIQRAIDTVFSTIPKRDISAKIRPQKSYYDWLP